jgi:hypothetical protein
MAEEKDIVEPEFDALLEDAYKQGWKDAKLAMMRERGHQVGKRVLEYDEALINQYAKPN